MVKVSVVIPVFNAGEYLRECLETIRNQTLQEIEIILVDDGSTDNSINILNEYVLTDNRFHLLQQKNMYAGIARNSGMRRATGKYLCFLDADDIFEITMLEEMFSLAEEYNSDIVLCNAYFFDSNTKEIQEPSWVLRNEYLPKNTTVFSYQDIPERIFQMSLPVPWNKLYRKSFIDNSELQFQGTRRCNDEYFVGLSIVLAERISIVNKRLVHYRINNVNSLQGMGNLTKASLDFYAALTALQDELVIRKIYKSVEKSFINKCLSSCVATLRKQKHFNNFSEVYHLLKEKAFTEFNIINHEKSYFYSNYAEFTNILKLSPEDYIFYENLKYKENYGEIYSFPYGKLEGARNIAIYAAGNVGKAFWRQLVKSNYYHLVAWFDSQYDKYQIIGLPVVDSSRIKEYEFDKVVIAIEDGQVAESVYNYIVEQDIAKSKIVYGMMNEK